MHAEPAPFVIVKFMQSFPLPPSSLPAWLNQAMLPYQSRMLETNGIHVHYIDEGTGPVFLMLHGNATWSFLYRSLIADLRHKYRCIAPDYPGFGLSGASEEYDFTPRSHAHCLERLILELDLSGITLLHSCTI